MAMLGATRGWCSWSAAAGPGVAVGASLQAAKYGGTPVEVGVPTPWAQSSAGSGATVSAAAAALAGAFAAAPRFVRRRVHTWRGARAAVRLAAVGLDQSGPLHFVKLTRGSDEATIYLLGACVASYKRAGVEWLALRGDAKLDGSKPNVSGGLPICFPRFGPDDVVPQHGFARNMIWRVVEDASDASSCVLELVDTDDTRKVWPHEFRCRYKVSLEEDRLATVLTVENLSGTECVFTSGLHSYYHVSDIDQLTVTGGFKGATKMDRNLSPLQPLEYDKDEITISEWTDDIYKKVLPGEYVLKDPAKGDLSIVSGGGWRDVVVWNPYGDDKVGYKNFVCVESVETDAVTLGPSKQWEATMDLVPNAI